MTKKYAICVTEFEFNPKKQTVKDAAISSEAEVIELCDTLDEAKEKIATVSPYTKIYSSTLAKAKVIYIEEGDYDYDENTEEWEFVTGANLHEIKYEKVNETEDEDDNI